MKTLLEILGLELPIIQAPMAGAQGSALAIAVCNSGGLGSLPCATLSPEAMAKELHTIRAATDRPFNVNFFCHAEPLNDPQRDAGWRRLLAPYYRELQLDESSPLASNLRAPFSADFAEALAEFRPPVISFHFGLPSRDLLDRIRAWNPTILSSATTVEEALWLEANGADIVIAQGLEAGGHRGHFLSDDLTRQPGTFALLPQVIDAVKVPVVAAGGIATAREVAAAMAMGAAGVQIGTTYLLCPEATNSRVHRAALASPSAHHTAITNLFTGRPARGIVNRLMRELGPLRSDAPAFPLASAAIAPLRTAAESAGSGDFSPLWAGQNVSGCRETPAGQLTRELASLL